MAKGFKRKGKFIPTGFKKISKREEFMETGEVDGVKIDSRVHGDMTLKDVQNWWNGMGMEKRKKILDRHESSFFKNKDSDTNFENLQFDIQRDIIDEFNEEKPLKPMGSFEDAFTKAFDDAQSRE